MTAVDSNCKPAIRSVYREMARRPIVSICVCGFFALFTGWLLSVQRRPEPSWHDEFSYLLLADTLMQGRLTNPPHPMWKHFETFHVIQQPTYASKYPPGQGMALAAGTLLTGEPIVGVWLSLALACAATCWMLQGMLPSRWALLGGMLATLRYVFGLGYFGQPYWSQSYFGGAVAALGGALLIGAAVRMANRPTFSIGIVMGIGLAILANSRPYEGLLISVITGCYLLFRLRNRPELTAAVFLRAVALPVALVMLPTAAFMGYYNWRITGSPWRFPYQVHEETYGVTPPFLWQPSRPVPEYRHAVMRDFHWRLPQQQESVSDSSAWRFELFPSQHNKPKPEERLADAPQPATPAKTTTRAGSLLILVLRRASQLIDFYLGILPGLCVLAALPMLRRGEERTSLALLAVFLAGMFQVSWFFPHYAAPAAGLIFYVAISALRRIRALKWGDWRIGRVTAVGLIGIVVMISVLPTALARLVPRRHAAWQHRRAQMIEALEATPQRHLILVRYSDRHSPHSEWVSNRADIDGAKIVWAREMGADENRKLIEYFSDRTPWLLLADENPPTLLPYEHGSIPAD